MSVTQLPVGFRRFHRQSFVNYQLNRLHALGFAEAARLQAAATRINHLSDTVTVLSELSLQAEAEGLLRQATSYQRGAEFFTLQDSPQKLVAYRRFRALFDEGFADVPWVRHDVAWENGGLPAYRLAALAGPSKGTVLLHAGFDSLIEEFFVIWERFAAAGYDVIAFDGPGQGGARALHGLTLVHDWEKPVAAILDHFGVEDVAIVGLSMGGYWAIRAAAFEPRIARVVSWPPVYDWLYQVNPLARSGVRQMVRFRRFMNASIRLRMKLVPVLNHAVRQAMYISGGSEPMHAVDWWLAMNHQHLSSERVTQDVLLLAGEHDAFQPPRLLRYQEKALTSAHSVHSRVFTHSDHADSHCQMGNIALACKVVSDWLDTT